MQQGLLERIRDGVIGSNLGIDTPYGRKPLVYADYTASGRCLDFVEDYIRQVVMPMYANTHSEASLTGAMANTYRERARETVRAALNGTTEDKVIFCGSGATSAVNRLIDVMGWRAPQQVADVSDKPVVFIGPYEHHSNELPWREAWVDLVRIPLNAAGTPCLASLDKALQTHAHRPNKLGSFSAASNVTGIRTDVAAVTQILKSHGALACWDYAAAGPYVGIDMNGEAPIDAVFISPHKFVGGPGTPGILVAKSHMFRCHHPAVVGGGTVAWVSPDSHAYVSDLEQREEGGTPAILETIRAGLVFELQQAIGTETIESLEREKTRRVLERLAAEDNIEILGPTDQDRLSIVSMRFRHGAGFLHHGFVVSLLNDLFGIQVRGGCSCAGPYGHELLGINDAKSKALAVAIEDGWGSLKPGWVRLNFNWFIADEEFDFLLEALALVARDGWRLMGDYEFDAATGAWRHQRHMLFADRVTTLADFLQASGDVPATDAPSLAETLELARQQLGVTDRPDMAVATNTVLPEQYAALQWFVAPAPRRMHSTAPQRAGGLA